MMSNEDYVKTDGQLCPACRGDELEFSEGENPGGAFVESVSCGCGLEFKRVFTLTGYEVKEVGEGAGLSLLDFMAKYPGCIHAASLATARRHQKLGGQLWSLCRDNKFRAGEVEGAMGWAVTPP